MKSLRSLRFTVSTAALIVMAATLHAQVAIGPTPGSVPNPNAMLDLQGSGRGFLAPRMTQAQRIAIGAAPAGLLVFQTDSIAGTTPIGHGAPGYYYYDATAAPTVGWRRVNSDAGWVLGGNAGTNPTTDFIGLISNQPLRFSSSGLERMRLNQTGRLSVSNTVVTPAELVEVNGGVRIGNSVANTPGTLRFNATDKRFEGYVQNAQVTGWAQADNAFRTRDTQPYTPIGTAPCTYSDGPLGNGAVTTWPLVDNAGFSNTSMGNTTESPYSTLWEDGRHQYLYLASDLVALNICGNEPIRGIGFNVVTVGFPSVNLYRVSMKNTLATSIPNFDLAGLTTCFGPFNLSGIGAGWTNHGFVNAPTGGVSTFLWAGAPYNLLIEVCHDNQEWQGQPTGGDYSVSGETTTFQANFGLFCDACGITIGSGVCFFSGTCPTTATAPGTPAASGSTCVGWGHTGGCSLTTANSLSTCDGTFQWQGGSGGGTRRPLLRINAKTQGGPGGTAFGQYLYSENAIMVGSAGWAASGSFPNQKHRGPGTISAEKSVFGGGVLLSDHVFDLYYDNMLRAEDVPQAMGYQHYPIREMANYVERERHLPTIAGRDQWEQSGGFSVDKLTNQLWVTVEEQSLYIKELNERMDALQRFLVEKRLQELKAQPATPVKK